MKLPKLTHRGFDIMEEKIFTEEELERYDGQNGNPAYVAIDGVVYDVTDVSAWKGGVHHGNRAVLEKLKQVGKLAESTTID